MSTKRIVHDILRDYPSTRDSDEELLLRYYIEYTLSRKTGIFIVSHFAFIKTFIRWRAYWQNTKGLYLPSEKVSKHRKVNQVKVTERMREAKRNFASRIYNYARRIIRNK